MGSSHPDTIDFAGDYNLNGVILQNHAGTGGKFGEGGVNIQSMVQELNIYEGITQNAVYGTLVIVDSTNIIGNLPIQGTERLMFKLSTPGASEQRHIIDASEETGHPYYVYKVSNKKLRDLDMIEGVPNLYTRETIEIDLDTIIPSDCDCKEEIEIDVSNINAYFWGDNDHIGLTNQVESGDYVEYRMMPR